MEKGSLVVLKKEPLLNDIDCANRNGIELPNTYSIYTVSKSPYLSIWMGIEIEVIQLEECQDGLELNVLYFVEIQTPKEANKIIKSLNQNSCKKGV